MPLHQRDGNFQELWPRGALRVGVPVLLSGLQLGHDKVPGDVAVGCAHGRHGDVVSSAGWDLVVLVQNGADQ